MVLGTIFGDTYFLGVSNDLSEKKTVPKNDRAVSLFNFFHAFNFKKKL